MISLPPAPHPGARVSAELLRNIIRCLRAATPLQGPGILLSRGPNGTVVSAVAASAPKAASPDRGCWCIVSGKREVEPEEEGDEPTEKDVRVFANRYYQIGGRIREHHPETPEALEDFILQGELEEGEDYTEEDKPWIAFCIPATVGGTDAPTVVGYKDLDELVVAQSDLRFIVKPLYKLSHDGSVLCDFRSIIDLGAWEIG
jgi:hypothetical protein